jgi:hypothetical protein
MPRISRQILTLAGLVLLGLLPLASAHGDDEGDAAMNMDMGDSSVERPTIPSISNSTSSEPVSYFQYGGPTGLMVAHIALMTLGWVFVLPVGECGPER